MMSKKAEWWIKCSTQLESVRDMINCVQSNQKPLRGALSSIYLRETTKQRCPCICQDHICSSTSISIMKVFLPWIKLYYLWMFLVLRSVRSEREHDLNETTCFKIKVFLKMPPDASVSFCKLAHHFKSVNKWYCWPWRMQVLSTGLYL